MAAESQANTPLTLPVLPLDDEVVLPGMVVPLDLNETDVRAAVEAAQAAAGPGGGKPQVLLMLERIFQHISKHPGVRWTTFEQIADDFAQRFPRHETKPADPAAGI